MPFHVSLPRKAGSLVNGLRWFVIILLTGAILTLGWYGWSFNVPVAWIFGACLLVALLVIFLRGSSITLWLAGKITRRQGQTVQLFVNNGLKKGEILMRAGGQELDRTLNDAGQALEQSLDSINRQIQSQPGTINWQTIDHPVINPEPICPSCGKKLRPSAKFCDACGLPVEYICMFCGHSLRPQAHFCDHCGKEQKRP